MQLNTTATQPDALIVGAGPAGLAAAIAAARQGLHVEVVDAVKPPIDKACGEGLLPGSLESLSRHRLRSQARPRSHRKCRPARCSFHRRLGLFEPIPHHPGRLPCTPGRGIRRTVLHQLLLDRAASLGVRFHWENTVRRSQPTAKSHRPHKLTDPSRSLPHRRRRSPVPRRSPGRTHRCHHPLPPHRPSPTLHRRSVEQTSSKSTGATTAGLRHPQLVQRGLHRLHSPQKNPQAPGTPSATFPALATPLASAQISEAPRGSITLGRTLHRVASCNIALIGDASGSVDAVTGEGLALGFRQAEALGLCPQRQQPRRLPARSSPHPTASYLMSRSLLLMDRSPRLRDRTLKIFARNPSLFQRLLRTPHRPHLLHLPRSDGLLQPDST